MTNIFRDDGHLNDAALLALVQEQPLDELSRLEIAEHLTYCDSCLQRYTDLLADTALDTPRNSCRETLWPQIRLRAARLFSQRYAAAVAAVALALTLLWGSAHPAFTEVKETFEKPEVPYSEVLQSRWDGAMEHTATWLSGLIDRIDPLQGELTP